MKLRLLFLWIFVTKTTSRYFWKLTCNEEILQSFISLLILFFCFTPVDLANQTRHAHTTKLRMITYSHQGSTSESRTFLYPCSTSQTRGNGKMNCETGLVSGRVVIFRGVNKQFGGKVCSHHINNSCINYFRDVHVCVF